MTPTRFIAQKSCEFAALIALAGGLLLGTTSLAGISGINTPGTSTASIQFDDTTSLDPSSFPGITNITPTVSPWTGAVHSLTSTTDPVTSDNAQGDISASFLGNAYSVTFSNVSLTQAPLNTGFAHLIFQFNVEYQLDALGLPNQATLFPNFSVNGTVQPGGFASVSGSIDYYGVNTAGTYSIVETVNYNQLYNVPGPFTGVVAGVPVNGTTPILPANTTMTLVGTINFMVDPASINAESEMVPEPFAPLLALPALLLRRRSRQP